MKQKTGYKEAVNLMIFITLPQLLCKYISCGLSAINSGYWLNFTFCALLAFLLVTPLKYAFEKTLNVYTHSDLLEKIISIVCVINISVLSLYNLKLCTNALSSLVNLSLSTDIIVFLPIVIATVCSGLGIEAIGRTAYFTKFVCIGIIFLICMVSFNGFDTDNIYPLFGNSFKKIFFDFSSVGIYTPLFSVYMLRDCISEPRKSYNLLKKSFFGVYIVGLILVILCILAIPYPMVKFYDFSLSAIFSISKSSVFFHRFEVLLIFFIMIISGVSVSVGLSLFSKKMSELTKSHDYKPFSLIFGALLFYICMIIKKTDVIHNIYNVTCVLLYLLLVLKSAVIFVKRKAKKGIT